MNRHYIESAESVLSWRGKWLRSLVVCGPVALEPPQVVANFVSHENVRNHFFNNMFRAMLAGIMEDNRRAIGLNYLQLRSVSTEPDAGLLLRRVSADVSEIWPDAKEAAHTRPPIRRSPERTALAKECVWVIKYQVTPPKGGVCQ